MPKDTPQERSDDTLRRAVVDLVGESRSRAVRIALFGEMIYRPDPDGVETEEVRRNNLKVLLDTVRWVERAHLILTTAKDPWDEYPDHICAWLEQFAKQEPEAVEQLGLMVAASKKVGQAAEAGSRDLGQALRDHYELRRGRYMAAVSALVGRIWSYIDVHRAEEMAEAQEAIKTTHTALKRMEQIATHVRLVAINAAIEANKLGDDGRGIAFIAAEFKSLAEELQTLSATARGKMSSGRG